MAKFKPFHEFQKPLIGFTPESFLDYVETVLPKDYLCRVVKGVVFSLDTEAIEAKYSFLGQRTYHPKLLCGSGNRCERPESIETDDRADRVKHAGKRSLGVSC